MYLKAVSFKWKKEEFSQKFIFHLSSQYFNYNISASINLSSSMRICWGACRNRGYNLFHRAISVLLQVTQEKKSKTLFYPNLLDYRGEGEQEKGHLIQKTSRIPVTVTR